MGLIATVGGAGRGFATMQTTTTLYQYNADHALTAVTATVNGQSSTVYLTWDDCAPIADNPASCTVSAGNGNLLGIGPAPGTSYTTQFGYDQRNRLTSAAASGAQSVAYTYHPASLMATSTLASGDALAFTYDVSPLPQMTNIEQTSTRTWTSYLGGTSYVSNGTEQVLCQPRQDVAGVYEPAAGSFSPLRYDPYGTVESASSVTSTPATGATSYDLTQNPFQYSSEYTDPAWSGLYLRARWYLPQYQTFLGRDPHDAVHRYGYAGANPLTNSDPSGLSYHSFSRSTDRAFAALTNTSHGPWWRRVGYIVPLVPVVGQIVGGATLLAGLPQLWHHGTEATWINFGFLAVSAAAEGQTAFSSVDHYFGATGAFLLRHGVDAVIGAGQTGLVEAMTQKGGRIDAPAVIQSAEYSVGAILSARDVFGIGYRPESPSVTDAEKIVATQRQQDDRDDLASMTRKSEHTPVNLLDTPPASRNPALLHIFDYDPDEWLQARILSNEPGMTGDRNWGINFTAESKETVLSLLYERPPTAEPAVSADVEPRVGAAVSADDPQGPGNNPHLSGRRIVPPALDLGPSHLPNGIKVYQRE
jgi:RHS repeat-associated protein